ncbi:HPP family protein [Aquirhabdus parva]|nr:HPP family protein [Aquirhabdus parva]
MTEFSNWLRSFVPPPLTVSKREIVYSCLGALIGLMFAEWLSRYILGEVNVWFVAPMGASAVLLFAVPASPLAQPWSIIGGNLVASLVGVLCVQTMSDGLGLSLGFTAAIAVAAAIGVMFVLRCLHPPSGAVAMTAVMGGPAIHALGYHFVVWPVLINSLFLLLLALIFNNALRHRYPHRAIQPAKTQDPPPSERLGFTSQDLDRALSSYGELLDINKSDLSELINKAKVSSFQRQFGDVRCADIMSKDVITVYTTTLLTEALTTLRERSMMALPVIDDQDRLVGMLSIQDFLVPRRDSTHIINPLEDQWANAVIDIMSHSAPTVEGSQPIGDLVQFFSDQGLHYVLIVDEAKHIQGIITQSDLVAALLEVKLAEAMA